MTPRLSLLLALNTVCLFGISAARADTFEKKLSSLGGGLFFDHPNSWTNTTAGGDGIPGKADTAVLPNVGSTQFVRLRRDEQSERILVTGGLWVLESDAVARRTYSVLPNGDLPDADLDVSGGELTIGSGDGGPLRLDAPEGILFIGVTNDGTVRMFRDGTELNMGGTSRTHAIGGLGGDGSLFIAEATANIGIDGTLDVASSNSSGTDGSLTVTSGGTLNTGNLNVANRNSGATGTVTIFTDDARIVQSATAALNLGSLVGGTGTMTILNGGVFDSGGGAQNINGTGTLDVRGGVYNGNGLVNLALAGTISIESGQVNARAGLNNTAGGSIEIADGRLLVSGGAFTAKTGESFVFDPGSATAEFAIGSGGTADFDNGFIAQSGRFTMEDGAVVTSFAPDVEGGVVTVHGATTTWSASGGLQLSGGNDTSIAIEAGARLDVTGDTDLGPNEGTFAQGEHLMEVTGPGSAFTSNGLVAIGRAARATLRVSDGGSVVVTNILRLINAGTLEVTGAGSAIQIGNHAFVSFSSDSPPGSSAQRGLRILDGGLAQFATLSVSSPDASSDAGRVTVNNAELSVSGAFDIGGNTSLMADTIGNGIVSLTTGAVAATTTTNLAATVGSTGEATIQGPLTQWLNSGDFSVGGIATDAGGDGLLTIDDGAVLEVGGVFRLHSGGKAFLAGGTVRADSELELSAGAELVLDGGTLAFDSTRLANEGSVFLLSGLLRLTNPGGYTVGAENGPLEQLIGEERIALPAGVGLAADQVLFIPASRSLSVVRGSLSGASIKNQGLITAIDSTLESAGEITNEADLVLIDSSVSGPLSTEGDATVTLIGTVRFNGLVSGSGGFFGPGKALFNGGFSPGASPADVTFEGNLALGESNTLFIELGGLTPGEEHDRLVIEGTTTLSGAIEVSLIDGYMPTLGDTFELLTTVGEIDGKFAEISEPDLGEFLSIDLLYETNRVLAVISATLDGDYNADGRVDAADYTVWRDGLGTTFTLSDYDVWVANFGATAQASSKAVPEPSAGLLLLVAICLRLPSRCRDASQ